MTEQSQGRKLIAFMNAYTQGMSGGDARFIEVVKRLDNFEKIVVTSLLGSNTCLSRGLRAKYLVTTREKYFRNVILTYLKRLIKALLLNIDINKNDILYSTSDFLPDVFPAFFYKIKNKDSMWVQLIFHLIPKNRKIPYCAQRISFLFIKNFADLIIVDNILLRKELVALGFKIQKVKVNTPGIDLKYFLNLKSEKKNGYDGVFLGRLHPSKGIFDLVKIWKTVCKELPNARLGIIGGGNEKVKKKLKDFVVKNNMTNNIDILGYLETNETFRIVKSSKIFLFPSYEEGFGMAILEAMACGVPVVAWNLPIYEDNFPRGIVKVPLGNINEFARRVIELLQNKILYKKISREAAMVAHKFDWSIIVNRENKLLNEYLLGT